MAPTPSTTLATTTPGTLDTTDRWRLLAREWAKGYRSPNTRAAYLSDLERWAGWCELYGVDVLDTDPRALEALANRWRLALEGDPDTLADHPEPAPAPLAPATIARRLSAVGGFYRWTTRQGVTLANPLAEVTRPVVDDDSTTLGCTLAEYVAMVRAARGLSLVAGALVHLLGSTGLRVSEALALDVGAMTTEDDHVVVRVVGKGGRRKLVPLAPDVVEELRTLEGGREAGPLFTDPTGDRLDRHLAAYLVRRAAELAGLTKRVTPHSLRHFYVTTGLANGVPLHVVQDGAGHRSPTTTRRYDRQRNALAGHANHTMGAVIARALSGG